MPCLDFKMVSIKTYLLLTIFEFTSIYCHANSIKYSEVKMKNWCYMIKNNSDKKCPINNDSIKINFKEGRESGSVIADFLLAPSKCIQSGYEIELLFDNGSGHSDKNCSNISSEVHHSSKKFKIFPCNNGSCTDLCSEYGSVYFSNIESGCYKADIKQITRNESFKRRHTNWTYISGSDNESWDTEIDIQDPVPVSLGLNINVKFSKPTSDVAIDLISESHIKKMNMTMLSENETCHFMKSKTDSESITKYDGVLCTFSYLPAEYLMIVVYAFKDEQCDYEMRNPKKTEPCWKIQKRGINIPSHKDRVTMEILDNWILQVTIICLLLLVFPFGIIIFTLSRRKRKPKNVSSVVSGEIALLKADFFNNDFEILLLYTKDCKEFMVTMESFRHLLRELCNVKIYDCFDEPNWEDEQISPHEWIEKMIKFNPCLHIVIVSTQCACIQYQKFLSNSWNANISAFKEPSCLDKIFLYGLQVVKDYEISNLAYGKIFIIQLNGFSEDTNSKELSSLSRVYQIPLHLKELLRDMKIASFQGNVNEKNELKEKYMKSISLEEDFEDLDNFTRSGIYIKFINHLENLRTFKKYNQNYLEEMLQPTILLHKSYRKIEI